MDNNVIDDAFNYIENVVTPPPVGKQAGADTLSNIQSMAIGMGSKAFHGDSSGIWLGGVKFEDARFSVDMDGNIIISSATTGAKITISSINKNIIVNDGTNDRVLIGFQSGGF